MLVYNLPAVGAIYDRFAGIDGSAYFIGGFGFTALGAHGRDRRSNPHRRRRPARSQPQLSQIHPARDLEPILTAIHS